MKTIGLLGGMSWESSAAYYKAINEGVKATLGGLHSAKIAMYSVDFYAIEQCQHRGEWGETAKLLTDAAQRVERAGADCLLICTNTMHKVADEIQLAIDIPLLHIADATAQVCKERGIHQVGLLGTQFTMEQDFYKRRLEQRFNLQVIVPPSECRDVVHKVIYDELCKGHINAASKADYIRIIEALGEQGAEAVILGCTEIGMLVSQADTHLRLLDTTQIHAQKAVEFALS